MCRRWLQRAEIRGQLISVLIGTVVMVSSCWSQASLTAIETGLLASVVKIEAEGGKSGSGFLICERVTDGQDTGKIYFLATVKHMVGDWTVADRNFTRYYDQLRVYFRKRKTADQQGGEYTTIDLRGRGIAVHPDSAVDVALVAITEIIQNPQSNLELAFITPSFLQPFDSIARYGNSVGNRVFVLGFPAGMISRNSLLPFAKSGYIASVPGEIVAMDSRGQARDGKYYPRRIEGKLILVDGLVMGGNSGGPVTLERRFEWRRGPTGQLAYSDQGKNLVIGILASRLGSGDETMGLVWSSDYILDILEKFNKEMDWVLLPWNGTQ